MKDNKAVVGQTEILEGDHHNADVPEVVPYLPTIAGRIFGAMHRKDVKTAVGKAREIVNEAYRVALKLSGPRSVPASILTEVLANAAASVYVTGPGPDDDAKQHIENAVQTATGLLPSKWNPRLVLLSEDVTVVASAIYATNVVTGTNMSPAQALADAEAILRATF